MRRLYNHTCYFAAYGIWLVDVNTSNVSQQATSKSEVLSKCVFDHLNARVGGTGTSISSAGAGGDIQTVQNLVVGCTAVQ